MLVCISCRNLEKVIRKCEFLPFYILSGNAVLTLKSNDAIKVVSIRGTNFEAAVDGGSASTAAAPAGSYASSISQWVSQELTKSDRPDLATAKIIISGGKFGNRNGALGR